MDSVCARVVEATLKYEALFTAPVFSLFDQPGRIYDAVLEPSRVVAGAWQALASLQSVPASVQTAAFEFELELSRQTFKSALERFAPAPAALPEGTETGVVFYLPSDPDKGYRPSSVFFDRSSVDGGMSCFGTLVYDGAALEPGKIVAAAWQRMTEILDKLDIRIGK